MIIKPFSLEYVLKITVEHCKKSIDISIQKTFDRAEEFKDDPVKSTEIFKTLSALHKLRKLVDDFQHINP